MNLIEAIGLVSGVASIAGFIYALYYARSSRRIKLLSYEVSPPVALATAVSPEDNYSLSVIFQRAGESEERIGSVYVRYLKMANLGREPIRGEDIAPANPLRVFSKGVRVLDISLTSVTREVNRLALQEEATSSDESSTKITFDFLDHMDGALLKILTVGGKGTIRLAGDIIGMPEGIKSAGDLRNFSLLDGLGCLLSALLELSALVMAGMVFYWVTGSWTKIWLLALPLVALIVPILIIALVGSTLWPESKPLFPKNLTAPRWFHRLQMRQYHHHHRLAPEIADVVEEEHPSS